MLLLVVIESNLAECRRAGWADSRPLPDNSATVLVKMTFWNADNSKVKLEVITGAGWAEEMLESVVHRIWCDKSLQPQLMEQLKSAAAEQLKRAEARHTEIQGDDYAGL